MRTFAGAELVGPELTSERLLLRPWHADDVPAIVAALAQDSMSTFLYLPSPYTEQDARDYLAALAADTTEPGLRCAVVERATGRLAGSAALRLAGAVATIGYWVAPEAQGRGIATEATRTLTDWAFAREVRRLEVHADVRDVASARVALAAGFGHESTRRDASNRPTGRWDQAVFARLLEDGGDPVPHTFGPWPPDGLGDGVVRLRVMLPDDLEPFFEQEDDELTRQVGFTGTTPPRHAMRRMLARAGLDLLTGQVGAFTIVDAVTGDFAGAIRLRVNGPPQVAGIGYAVHPAWRGRGYTARALRLLAAWAFGAGGFARLELGAKVDNLASQRAALSAGFTPEGVWRARLRNVDGTFSDEARFGLVAPRQSASAAPSLISP